MTDRNPPAADDRVDGLLRFDQYMAGCLYDPRDGFYTSGRGRAGRRHGDFVTSPEVGPLFGAVLARMLDVWWRDLGHPDPFVVVDAGAGPGSLVRALELAEPSCASAWDLREVDPACGVPDAAVDAPRGDVVIANELLDNLPFQVVELGTDGCWSEVWVRPPSRSGADVASIAGPARGRWTEELCPIDGPPAVLSAALGDAPVPGRWPVLTGARQWVEECLAAGTGRIVAFDYGAPATASLVARGGWLRTYRAHERGDDPYVDPGAWDITTDIGFDQLPAPASLDRQSVVLRQWGIEDLVAEGRAHWAAHAARPDLVALRMRSRSSEAAALLDPSGLGGWWCAQWMGSARI